MAFNSGGAPSVAAGQERNIFVPAHDPNVCSIVATDVYRGANGIWIGVFTVANEDHTTGGLLTRVLDADPRVIAAGYFIPHPLEAEMKIRIHTREDHARQVLDDAVDQCMKNLATLRDCFKTSMQQNAIPAKPPS